MKHLILWSGVLITSIACSSNTKKEEVSSGKNIAKAHYTEPHRPQFHFSPDSAWMNDPNGMVYHDGTYHLFYQYYPDSTVWGPMHWGHAVSKDMINWVDKPIAIYPDEKGYIFSGSAVFDKDNTSGLGTLENPPLVAIYTIHDMEAERAGEIIDETQGIAFSIDKGETWTKYENNPVLENPGIEDFRDPKVRWHGLSSKWIMTLAVKDHIRFYASENLLEWELMSEFGKEVGAHGGVWECPDLFELEVGSTGEKKWVLFVSINPGGPNKGSATQYFVGNFDGKTFTPDNVQIKWIDYGPDNYAGVTWANTDEKIFLGWMSNWLYAQVVPTKEWRSAMTIPRRLELGKVGSEYFVKSWPHENILKLNGERIVKESDKMVLTKGLARIDISGIKKEDFKIEMSNELGESIEIGYSLIDNEYYIDRSESGKVGFHEKFKDVAVAPRISIKEEIDVTLLIDDASIELFADGGLTTMTAIFFPNATMKSIQFDLNGEPQVVVTELNGADL